LELATIKQFGSQVHELDHNTTGILNNVTPLKLLIGDLCRREDLETKKFAFKALEKFFYLSCKLDIVRFIKENKKIMKELMQTLFMSLKLHGSIKAWDTK
jgi:hypothetical protein